jgi:hypothetical protein
VAAIHAACQSPSRSHHLPPLPVIRPHEPLCSIFVIHVAG